VDAVEKTKPVLDAAKGINATIYRLHAIRGEIAKIEEPRTRMPREYNAAVTNLPASTRQGPLYGIQLHMI